MCCNSLCKLCFVFGGKEKICLWGFSNVATIKAKQCQKYNIQFSINVNRCYSKLAVITIPCVLSNKKYATFNPTVLAKRYLSFLQLVRHLLT